MGATPEGAVKKLVKEMLNSYGPDLHYFMPVQGGFGPSLLDFYGCYRGKFFAIETKAPGKKPTDRQTAIMNTIITSRGKVFVIDGEMSSRLLKAWLNGLID